MKAFKFKLYNHQRNRHLKKQIEIAAEIYNHCIALHKRYYRLYGKYLNVNKLKIHLTKLKKLSKFTHWNKLGSQAIQDVVERIDRAYKLFFSEHKKGNQKIRPPTFKKRSRYKSFTLKQAGYKLLQGNHIRIGERIFRYFKSRESEGNIHALTVKRDRVGDLYIIAATDANTHPEISATTGKTAGFDFGLKTFLTVSDGTVIESPQFFSKGQKEVRKANRSLSRKQKGSKNRKKANLHLARVHRRIAFSRDDFHWKLAEQLTNEYDILCFETLNLDAMKRLWGKKVSDLSFYSFLQKVKYLAQGKGKRVVFVDQWFASSKICSVCSFKHENLLLKERVWTCPKCQTHHHRDLNAAINIGRAGASALRGV
jgi:putative transposase